MYIYIYNYIYVLYIYTRKGLSNAKKNTRHTSIMYAFHGQIGCTKQWLAGKQWPRNQCCAWWPLTTRSHSSRVITLDTEDPSSFQSWWSCCFGALQKNWKRTIGHWFVYPCGMVFWNGQHNGRRLSSSVFRAWVRSLCATSLIMMMSSFCATCSGWPQGNHWVG